ncbi:MAG: hypothetical protein AAB426_14715 [Myxococcota bacterium]
MASLRLSKIKVDEDSGVVTVRVTFVRDEDEDDVPWHSQEALERHVAALWGWEAARMLEGSDMDESLKTRELRFMRHYEWTVKIRVAATWVADGFDLTAERAHSMVAKDLGYARGDEIETEIVAAPPDRDIATEQGYAETADGLAKFLKDRT